MLWLWGVAAFRSSLCVYCRLGAQKLKQSLCFSAGLEAGLRKYGARIGCCNVESEGGAFLGTLCDNGEMLTKTALAEHIRRRVPTSPAEHDSIARGLVEIDRLADPTSEVADPVHLTGSGIVVGERGVVLLKHRRLGMWLQPGGHIDPGETPWDAAKRESVEETGLDVAFHSCGGDGVPELVHVDVHDGGRGHTHIDLRYVLWVNSASDPVPPAHESQEVAWFGWSAAIERVSDSNLRVLLAQLRPTFDGSTK